MRMMRGTGGLPGPGRDGVLVYGDAGRRTRGGRDLFLQAWTIGHPDTLLGWDGVGTSPL